MRTYLAGALFGWFQSADGRPDLREVWAIGGGILGLVAGVVIYFGGVENPANREVRKRAVAKAPVPAQKKPEGKRHNQSRMALFLAVLWAAIVGLILYVKYFE